ncbi:MAG: MFS transporter, partial [Armatimonadota bacterium]
MSTFRALRHRNFRLFWTGQLFSLTGTWMQNIAQGWLVQRIVRQEMGDANLSLYLGIVAARASPPQLR